MGTGKSADALRLPLPTRRSTKRLARGLARVARRGDVLLLEGGLGVGKTFLVRSLARELGVPASVRITSPTFELVHEFQGTVRIVHADLYRLNAASELDELGLLDEIGGDAVVVVEWGARFVDAFFGTGLRVDLTLTGDQREARVTPLGECGEQRLRSLAAVCAVW